MTKDTLMNKSSKKTHCFKCKKGGKWVDGTDQNPRERCHECKNAFCFDHLWGGQVNDTMKLNEKIRSVCDKCRDLFKYRTV